MLDQTLLMDFFPPQWGEGRGGPAWLYSGGNTPSEGVLRTLRGRSSSFPCPPSFRWAFKLVGDRLHVIFCDPQAARFDVADQPPNPIQLGLLDGLGVLAFDQEQARQPHLEKGLQLLLRPGNLAVEQRAAELEQSHDFVFIENGEEGKCRTELR